MLLSFSERDRTVFNRSDLAALIRALAEFLNKPALLNRISTGVQISRRIIPARLVFLSLLTKVQTMKREAREVCVSRRLHRFGVGVGRGHWNSLGLQKLRCRMGPDPEVRVRFDPHDMTWIDVYDPSSTEWIKVLFHHPHATS
jgi:Mu transposase, C-terminal